MKLWTGEAIINRASLLYFFLFAFGVRSLAGGLGAHLLMTGFGRSLIPCQLAAILTMLGVIACSSLFGGEDLSGLVWGFCCFFLVETAGQLYLAMRYRLI